MTYSSDLYSDAPYAWVDDDTGSGALGPGAEVDEALPLTIITPIVLGPAESVEAGGPLDIDDEVILGPAVSVEDGRALVGVAASLAPDDPITVTATVHGSLGVKTPWTPYPNPAAEPGWSARVVDMTGSLVATLPYINVDDITSELNRPTTARFHYPKHRPELANIQLGCEVQLFRNNQLMVWGPVIGARGDSRGGAISFEVADPMWYLERKYFGSAERQNRMRNGGFEAGLDHWTPVRCTAEVVSDGNVVRGDNAVRLHSRTDPNAYLSQTRVWDPEWPADTWVVATAWVYVSSTWQGPAHEHRGLWLVRRSHPSLALSGHRGVEITEDTPRGQWVKLTTGITMPSDQLYSLELRLYALAGVVRWDEARVLLHESTSLDASGNDMTEAVRRIVVHSQTGRNKSSENIGTNTPPSGVHLPLMAWQHAAHQPIMEPIRGFIDSNPGIDVSIEVTPTTRTFTTHSPTKGTDRSGAVTLRADGPNRNCSAMRYDSEIGRTANSVIVLGTTADGVAREEGGAIDESVLPHGQVLEDLISAPPDTPIAQLDRLAAEELRARKGPVAPIEVDVIDRNLIGLIETGDLVAVDIDDGWYHATGVWRAVRIRINGKPGGNTAPMTLTLNRVGDPVVVT